MCALLPDVSKATVYRHVGLLADGGVLDVADEQRVRGAVERRYRLRRERAVIDADTAASVSVADHRRVFAVAMATLLAEFNAYLDREGADPTADLVGYPLAQPGRTCRTDRRDACGAPLPDGQRAFARADPASAQPGPLSGRGTAAGRLVS
ncbi:hypothetical protein [Streptomyces tubercidicus]|uniref:hypothetical protein n=1 Tax=Streptomyces tubercidicus TaxID=47759 RepID=UPI0037931554